MRVVTVRCVSCRQSNLYYRRRYLRSLDGHVEGQRHLRIKWPIPVTVGWIASLAGVHCRLATTDWWMMERAIYYLAQPWLTSWTCDCVCDVVIIYISVCICLPYPLGQCKWNFELWTMLSTTPTSLPCVISNFNTLAISLVITALQVRMHVVRVGLGLV